MKINKIQESAALVLALPAFLLAAGCCPGKGKDRPGGGPGASPGQEQPSGPAKIGDTVRAGDCEFRILEAKKKTELKHYKSGEAKKTAGFFLEVRGSMTNRGRDIKQKQHPLQAHDSRSRKYESMESQDEYLPDACLSLWSADVKPGETFNFGILFEFPADAKGIRLELVDIGMTSGSPVRLVDLGV